MDTPSVIKIQCPCCSATLAVRAVSALRGKSLTCPVCKAVSPFNACRPVATPPPAECTELPSEATALRTDVAASMPGRLTLRGRSDLPSFPLREGRNVVGRQASASAAHVCIPTGPSRRLSREHLLIEVRREVGVGLVHYASLCKERCNATSLNGQPLLYGDCVVLCHGDVLQLPDAELLFEIPDPEGTEYQS